MCSFDIQYASVAQKLREWQGGQIGPPAILIIFELYKHIVPKKNTYLMWN